MKKIILSLLTLFAFNCSFAQSYPDANLLKDLEQYSKQSPTCSELACNSTNSIQFSLNNKTIYSSFDISSRQNSFLTLPFSSQEVKIIEISLNNKVWHQIIENNGTYSVIIPKGNHKLLVKIQPINSSFSLTQLIPNVSVSNGLTLDERNNSSIISLKENINHLKDDKLEKSNYPTESFYQVNRTLSLDNSWKIITTIKPIFNNSKTNTLEIPLFKGEKLLNSDIKVENDKAIISISNQSVSWESTINSVDFIEVPKSNSELFTQIFSVNSSNIWTYTPKGKNPFSISGNSTSWALWNNETIQLQFKTPDVYKGKTLSLSNLNVQINKENDEYSYEYSLNAKTTLATKMSFKLPDDFTINSLSVNQQSVNIDKNSKTVSIDLLMGDNSLKFNISSNKSQTIFKSIPYVEFPEKVYNSNFSLNSNDWILFSGGADINSDYIIFSSLITLFIIAFLTKKISPSLSFVSISFILFGFLQNSLMTMLILPILLSFAHFKSFIINEYQNNKIQRNLYNLYQFIMILISFVFIVSFLITLQIGLLNNPSSWILYDNGVKWFNELYSNNTLWYIELDSFVYHIIMFSWAIFVSYHLINITKLVFKSIFSFELWIKKQTDIVQPTPVEENIEENSPSNN